MLPTDEPIEPVYVEEIRDGRPYVQSDCAGGVIGGPKHWIGLLAMLTDAEAELLLPDARCEIELRDLKTGRTYQAMWSNAAKPLSSVDAGWFDGVEVPSDYRWTLFDYGIAAHFCPCHREGSISGGVEDPDDECTDGRWMIVKATHAALPGVELYREEVVAPPVEPGTAGGEGRVRG
jgi:hypothetical protein